MKSNIKDHLDYLTLLRQLNTIEESMCREHVKVTDDVLHNTMRKMVRYDDLEKPLNIRRFVRDTIEGVLVRSRHGVQLSSSVAMPEYKVGSFLLSLHQSGFEGLYLAIYTIQVDGYFPGTVNLYTNCNVNANVFTLGDNVPDEIIVEFNKRMQTYRSKLVGKVPMESLPILLYRFFFDQLRQTT